MRFVKANTNEYLVIGRNGTVVNKGLAAGAWLLPGSTFVKISSTQRESVFEITQESSDSIPLRFKGIVLYRVARPVEAARLFDFVEGSGHGRIAETIAHVCMGELRAAASHMTMRQCVEERKTTLTMAVYQALRNTMDETDWGLEIDVLQVAQVYVIDLELRRQLEAEARHEIKAASELSAMRTRDDLERAGAESERHSIQRHLETEKERVRAEQEKQNAHATLNQNRIRTEFQQEELRNELEHQRVQKETPARLEDLKQQIELLNLEKEKLEKEVEVKELQARAEMMMERERHRLRMEALPLEQRPQMAEALSGLFRNATLSFYGEDSHILGALVPALHSLAAPFRESATPGQPGHGETLHQVP